MGALADVSLGDIVEALKRYRPVLATLGVVVFVLTVVLPDPPPRTEPTGASSFAQRAAERGRATPATQGGETAAATAGGQSVTVTPAGASFTGPSPSSSSPASTTFGGTSFSSTAGPSGGTFGDDDSSGREDFTFAAPTFVQPGEEQAAKEPLRIVAKAWHTRSAGTPVASQGVPAGTLPVGTRATLQDKVSFVRLAGDADVLRLSEDPAGNRSTAGAAAVQMCQVTRAGWAEGEAKPIQDAPPHDGTKCVNGTRAADGTWTFDLSSFDTRADDRGFALLPGSGASPDFQVAFKPS